MKLKNKIKRSGILFVISSPSGAGKTTLARKLIHEDKNIELSVVSSNLMTQCSVNKYSLNDKNKIHLKEKMLDSTYIPMITGHISEDRKFYDGSFCQLNLPKCKYNLHPNINLFNLWNIFNFNDSVLQFIIKPPSSLFPLSFPFLTKYALFNKSAIELLIGRFNSIIISSSPQLRAALTVPSFVEKVIICV